jgi:hypothetical protein
VGSGQWAVGSEEWKGERGGQFIAHFKIVVVGRWAVGNAKPQAVSIIISLFRDLSSLFFDFNSSFILHPSHPF